MMQQDKIAVIYGAGGDNGGAVARALARAVAKLILSGRNLRKVEAVAAGSLNGASAGVAALLFYLGDEGLVYCQVARGAKA